MSNTELPICPKCGGDCSPIEAGYVCEACSRFWEEENIWKDQPLIDVKEYQPKTTGACSTKPFTEVNTNVGLLSVLFNAFFDTRSGT